MKHTEGPWHVWNEQYPRVGPLIAAAPEMLAALKMVLQFGRIDDSESRMNQVAAAITKAESDAVR